MKQDERKRLYDRINDIDLTLAAMSNRPIIVASLSRDRVDLMRRLQDGELRDHK